MEKESRIRETMLMMGLKQWVLWSTWYLKQFLFLLLPVIVICILLKVTQLCISLIELYVATFHGCRQKADIYTFWGVERGESAKILGHAHFYDLANKKVIKTNLCAVRPTFKWCIHVINFTICSIKPKVPLLKVKQGRQLISKKWSLKIHPWQAFRKYSCSKTYEHLRFESVV